MNGSFNPGQFLKEIIPHLSISIDIRVKVGFSFIGAKYEKLEPQYSYFFAAPDLCTIRGTFYKRQELMEFAEKLEQRQHHDFLNETFLESESGDIFTNSGIGPHTLVACYIWVSKCEFFTNVKLVKFYSEKRFQGDPGAKIHLFTC